MQEKVLPSLDLQAVPLSDFLDFVSQLVPGFQYVIVRDAGVPNDFPTLPSMKLKKVTFGQVMSIIQEAIPLIETHPVESEKGAVVHVFKIHGTSPRAGAGPDGNAGLSSGRCGGGAGGAECAGNAAGTESGWRLGAGRVRQADQAAKQAARKKIADDYHAAVKASQTNALNAVLSLIKAALAQAGDGSVSPIVQIHEETQTLIVRGSPEQISAVQKALEALTPQAVLAPLQEKFAETEHRYAAELAKSNDELSRRNAELQVHRRAPGCPEGSGQPASGTDQAPDRARTAYHPTGGGAEGSGQAGGGAKGSVQAGGGAEGSVQAGTGVAEEGSHGLTPDAYRMPAQCPPVLAVFPRSGKASVAETIHTFTTALAAGDPAAVEAFYRRYFDMLYSQARRATGRDEAFCLDVVQESVLRVIRSVRAAHSEAQFNAWLNLVVRTAAYDLLRGESRRRKRERVMANCARKCLPTTKPPMRSACDGFARR